MDLIATAQQILAGAGIRVNFNEFLVLFGLVLARLAAAVTLVPFFGGGVPGRIKFGLSAILAAVIYPSIAPNAINIPLNGLVFVALLAKEIMIGATIGLLAQLVFYTVQIAGTIIDTQRGMNQFTIVAPQLPGNSSAIGQLQFQATLVLFLVMNGHLIFIRGMQNSFRDLPILTFPNFQPGLTPLLDQMIRISADVLLVALRLSAPVLVALFLVDVCFGAIGKVASQINVHQESQPVKSLAGLGVFLLAIGLIFQQLVTFLTGAMARIFEVVRAFQ